MDDPQTTLYGRMAELRAFLEVTAERCHAMADDLERHQVGDPALRKTVEHLCHAIGELADESERVQNLLRGRS